MRTFKSDGRYKYYSQGLGHIVEFRWADTEDRRLFLKLRVALIELYGDDNERVTGNNGYSYWKGNEYWRSEQNRSAKRRRIYLKDETALSLILLRVE